MYSVVAVYDAALPLLPLLLFLHYLNHDNGPWNNISRACANPFSAGICPAVAIVYTVQ